MIQNMDIARAYLIEANNDYDVISLLIENKKFSIAVFHAQQAVEKLLKACLAADGEIGIYKHEIFSFFLHPVNTYEKAATSRFRTRMTQVARIFTDTCSSASFPLSVFYCIYSLIDEDKNPQISQIRADLSNVGSDIKGTMKSYTCSRETGSRWFCPAIYSLRKSAQSVFNHGVLQ